MGICRDPPRVSLNYQRLMVWKIGSRNTEEESGSLQGKRRGRLTHAGQLKLFIGPRRGERGEIEEDRGQGGRTILFELLVGIGRRLQRIH